jgi:hypothetical protein
MTTLFGVRIFPDRKKFTDDELVSQVRAFLEKHDGRRKWWLAVHVVAALATILLIVWLLRMLMKMAPILNGAPGAQEIWFILGLIMGWSAGHMFSATVHSLIGVVGDTMDIRTKRLLVRYYDAYTAVCPADESDEPQENASNDF